ncbi:type III-B CRISPR module-associated protein Cmr5 [Thermobifida halotolerans]|uniref:CRISPR type III-B/RAMP module-associated protein Cmr5 n=1 Tax=Thermobifida halotolerans TaxID=483545 RepID=A0A399G5Z7_9ACTN|nr:type III-B CRISPR module-associated protein Cmr5 [Thermobifida halotolerans]UOE19088.1 type III-B CRISPR module-associated protein Cmr5 [Thermobifida halotolerans]
MRRLDQGMARDAALLLPEGDPARAKELRTRFRRLPVQLRTSGLAATYAFLAARSGTSGSDPLGRSYADVAQQVRARLADAGLLPAEVRTAAAPAVHRTVLRELGEMDTARYARATAEVALLFGWLRRLAEAVYVEEES